MSQPQEQQATNPPADMRPRTTDVEPSREPVGEPRSEAAAAPVQPPRMAQPAHQTELWPDMAEFRQRFQQIEAEFVHEPRTAVKKAEGLIDEAVDRMARELRAQMQRIRADLDQNHDTEQLRVVMLTYRGLIDTMGGRRAA
jgi:hypothetical protein